MIAVDRKPSTVLVVKDIDASLINTRHLRVQGRRVCCTVREASIHVLVWVLTSIGVNLEVDLIGDDEAVLDPKSVNPSELSVAIQQLRDAGLDAVANEVQMIEVLLCVHLGQYET